MSGCCDVLTKPLNQADVERLLDTFVPNHETAAIACSGRDYYHHYRIVGYSDALARTVDLARKRLRRQPVLITGERHRKGTDRPTDPRRKQKVHGAVCKSKLPL